MNKRYFFAAAISALLAIVTSAQERRPNGPAATTSTTVSGKINSNPSAAMVYELRIYTFNEDKREALLNRFRQHTLSLFKKHGIESIGYWLPLDTSIHQLHFLLRYPSREARDSSWKNFLADPEWQAAYKESESNGAILAHPPENFFLQPTDFSPEIQTGDISHGGVFELRTYTTPEGLLPNLDARFRNHTLELFKAHGMMNYGYWHRMSDQPAANVTLQYLLAHKSKEAAAASFSEFGKDPAWTSAKAASEKEAGGSLTVKDGVKSIFLVPTDFSPTK